MKGTTTSTIIIRPVGTAGMFEARLDGLLLCTSREPLLAAARMLLAEGWPPDTVVRMRRESSPHLALQARVGVAAALTVEDGRDGVPRFRKWKPPPSVGPASPVRLGGEAAPTLAPQSFSALSSKVAEVAT